MGHLGSRQWKAQTWHLLHFAQKDVSAFLSVYLEANKIICKGYEKQTRHNTFLRGYLSASSKCVQGHYRRSGVILNFAPTEYNKILKEIEITSGNLRNLKHRSNVYNVIIDV